VASKREIDHWVAKTNRVLTVRSYSERSRDTYVGWIRRFLEFECPPEVDPLQRRNVDRFLDHLAGERGLAPKSRNQALSALNFFFREILGSEALASIKRAREPSRIPTVLSHRQVALVLKHLQGKYRLLGALMYGCGLRLTEAHQLRVKDIDFDLLQIAVRDGKGAKDRWVMLPDRLLPPLSRQVDRVQGLNDADRQRGAGWAQLPGALARKDPNAGYHIGWQFLFPASRWTKDPATQRRGRYHLSPTSMQRSIKRAAQAAGIRKPVTCHTLRRSFATQMLRAGYDVRSVQRLLGHSDVRTTMIYVQAVTEGGLHIRSPLDQPDTNN